jgi:DNA-binding NarL/FixJ family response regulator
VSGAPPSVVVVDDDPSFLATVRLLLEAEGFAVVGEALTGTEGVRQAGELRPDVVLVDVSLPDIDGFEVAERVGALAEPPPVVLTSSREEADFGGLVAQSPARGFIGKGDITGPALAALAGAPPRA